MDLLLSPEDKEFVDDMIAWVTNTLGANVGGKFAENDWTAIVKMHAMVETALNTTLLAHFGFPELERVISRLDTSNMATGKVAFAKALGIVRKEAAVFIQKLSELRNFCVHDIRNFDFNLVKYVDDLDEHHRKALIKAIDKITELTEAPAASSIEDKLFLATIGIIIELRIHHMRCETRELKKEGQRVKAQLYDAQNPPKPKEA